ncbi:similar to Saccharomyces cerevisiae YNL117W MLS1 Malate synthase, enzyme of the glyoxylate cycle, involved in utilization of non-fermentable carbon sources [Maudiozyma saulgeensis]|uniref:Malate synthase n=1 Tax=Maudiozyma saulgeensis TaxID=1789683 RepID=A0A1X7QZF0_9SACH|nr:similar to Saccharomyces cerevisiae YNL117W MLS1 Malate synthase, enzyme of the glyoxylate cycle, involved in utilization of non-fermentable carbon sources [Kazachstania saulgeensis]
MVTNPKSLENVSLRIPKDYVGQLDVTTTYKNILTQDALRFIVLLHRKFNNRRLQLLENRTILQRKINDKSYQFDFLPETAAIRNNPIWSGPTILAPGLIQRHTEITGPPVRNMVINALNSDVDTYMTDFEDSLSPTWSNLIDGQINLYDTIREKVDFTNESGKNYSMTKTFIESPTLIMRPRGWHMEEKHLYVDGEPISASIFDFGLYFFHNCNELIKRGKGPYFYLPKMEHHLEAKLWNDIFNVSQDCLEIPRGTIRATVLIETFPAVFQMEEIIFQLRQHSSGLNCGRWDYLFSTIKRLMSYKEYILPSREQITMETPFMDTYVSLLINTCHRRGVHAMGGMAAQIPIKDDSVKNNNVMMKVIRDKTRELNKGHDGSWIAHPSLAKICNQVFHSMGTKNQLYKIPTNFSINENIKLLLLPNNELGNIKITEENIEYSIKVTLLYMGSWLQGNGCVPIDNLMEDAATAEVSRCQLYQWVKHKIQTTNNKIITISFVSKLIKDEADRLYKQYNNNTVFYTVAKLLLKDLSSEQTHEFLTVLLYDELIITENPTIESHEQEFPSKL